MFLAVIVALGITVVGTIAAYGVGGDPTREPGFYPEAYVRMQNPAPPAPESVAQGRALFSQHCARCHGEAGRGDGAEAGRFYPRPKDFTHAKDFQHKTDGQIFYSITKGIPGTAMPAWEESLSGDERWHIVNFIRSVAPRFKGQTAQSQEARYGR